MKKVLLVMLLLPALVSVAQPTSQPTPVNINSITPYIGACDNCKTLSVVNGATRLVDGQYLSKTRVDSLIAALGGFTRFQRMVDSLIAIRSYVAATYQLKGNYLTSYSETDPKRALYLTVSGSAMKTVTLTLADSTKVTAQFADNNDGAGGTAGVASFNGRTGTVVPATNDYAIADITGLTTALAGKQASGDYATNTVLTNGLSGKANTSHTHASSDITGTKTSAFISDFQSSVSSNTDVAANTAARHTAETGATIKTKLEALTGSNRLDASAIKNLAELISQIIHDSLNASTIVFNGNHFEKSGDTISIKTELLGGTSLTQLSAPSLNATAASSSQINVTVGSVTNATSYNLDWSANGTSGWTSIATTSGTYNHTGLTAETQYFYRARTVGDNTTYSNSTYATANATTQAASGGGVEDVVFTTQTNLVNTSGTWTASGDGAQGVTSKKLPSGVDGITYVTYVLFDAQAIYGFKTASTNGDFNTLAGSFWFDSGNIWRNELGGYTNTGTSVSDGNLVGVRRTGSTLTLEKSIDGGDNWTVIYTFTGTSYGGDLYIGVSYLNSSAILHSPKATNLQ